MVREPANNHEHYINISHDALARAPAAKLERQSRRGPRADFLVSTTKQAIYQMDDDDDDDPEAQHPIRLLLVIPFNFRPVLGGAFVSRWRRCGTDLRPGLLVASARFRSKLVT